MQNDLDRESVSLQGLETQKQDSQERLEEMDQQRSKLEGMLNDVKQKCQEESQMVRKLPNKNNMFIARLFPSGAMVMHMWTEFNYGLCQKKKHVFSDFTHGLSLRNT